MELEKRSHCQGRRLAPPLPRDLSAYLVVDAETHRPRRDDGYKLSSPGDYLGI